MKFGLVKILFLFTFLGFLIGFYYNHIHNWYVYNGKEISFEDFEKEFANSIGKESTGFSEEDEDKLDKKWTKYVDDSSDRTNEWVREHSDDKVINFIVIFSITTIISITIWRILLSLHNNKPLKKLDIKVSTSIVNSLIKEKVTEL